ncbi:aminotransferase class V-fold PLP-dependent enzyme [Lysinibacillus sp. LZ02]|uniref:aminotransferase class V-fold PLP-dependent enzyme n=1 Tax=Lysinibacillus sp. LZ02 TaxID=3420668 RepID=UPI003D36A530
MYWTKIATTEKEFEQIAELNYETFVEEIPQHRENTTRRLVDRFHHENTYIVVYKEAELVGMVAFRAIRPFSLDEKIGPVEHHLPKELCRHLCELRLLAVKKEHRNGRVMLKLFKALYAYFYEQDFSACVISGTTREEKMYKQIGFTQFAPAVGPKEAQYLPMVLTKESIDTFRHRMLKELKTFYPGPVKQATAISHTEMSHRSIDATTLYQDVKRQLLELANSRFVATIVGSGTAANEAMLGAVKATCPNEQGLVLSNGEFGERLIQQARNWQLSFTEKCYKWGEAFNLEELEHIIKEHDIKWLAFVHGETSTGTLNPFNELILLCQKYDVKLCVDCISSFGTHQFSLQDVFCATAVSGKAIGALSGLAFVFYNEVPTANDHIPCYFNLSTYHEKMPFTVPVYLLANTFAALEQYPARFEVLQNRLELVLTSPIYMHYGLQTVHYPIIVTFVEMEDFYTCTQLNDFALHGASRYLKQRGLVQLSIIQPTFEKDFAALVQLFSHYKKLM